MAIAVGAAYEPDDARAQEPSLCPEPGPAFLPDSGPARLPVAGWADLLGPPGPERPRSRRLARLGGIVALTAVLGYLTWRVGFTLPASGPNRAAALALVTFEALPLLGMVARLATIWNIDSAAPPLAAAPDVSAPLSVAVLIPTYDEPAEVIAPTIAAACALQPAHETWVLDDGDRAWVAEICRTYGARYVCRPVHDHAKAGNLNHALDLMAAEAALGGPEIAVIAVLDCDHVPLEGFLTSTLGWFADPEIALVQGPQSFYNAGAFDDDGVNGEQGLFFNVLMAARNHAHAGPFWCGSTALVRTAALREIGGVATDTIVEDMHTTLRLLRQGWRTVYHHQTLAVGLAPATAEQYLVQRRRWGLGAMQVMASERLWAAKRWLSWRNYYEYLGGTLWWLEGAATLFVLMVPVTLLVSGAQTSTAPPLAFAAVFLLAFFARLWGAKRLYRHQLSWTNALALRVLRIPVGISCIWWLLTRRTLEFQVTPKEATQSRVRSRVPRVLVFLVVALGALVCYATLGVAGLVPWRASPGATVASGAWLVIAATAVTLGTQRIRAIEFASSRRNAHRFNVPTEILLDGEPFDLVDISAGGLSVRMPDPGGTTPPCVAVTLPGSDPVTLDWVRSVPERTTGTALVSLRVAPGNWAAMGTLSLWIFHTPPGAVPGLGVGVPAAAVTQTSHRSSVRRSRDAAAEVRDRAMVLHD